MLRAGVGRGDAGRQTKPPSQTKSLVNTLRTKIWLLPAIVAFALPSAAAAEEVVPPSNSAATQYTEAIPTAGGPKQAGKQKPKQKSPSKVLGNHTTKKLDKHGADGKAAAKIAAETAPAPVVTPTPDTSQATSDAPQPSHQSSSGHGHKTKAQQHAQPANNAPPAHDKGGQPSTNAEAPPPQPQADQPSGSSGFGEVLAQATGSSSSGGMGLLLPLVILAAIAWAIAYAARQRKRTAS